MQGKPVADIDEVMNRVEGRGQGRRDEPPATEGGGTYGNSNVRVKIKGGSDPNRTFPSSIMGETTPPRVKKPEGNDSGGGSATDEVGIRIKGNEDKSIRGKIKGGKRRETGSSQGGRGDDPKGSEKDIKRLEQEAYDIAFKKEYDALNEYRGERKDADKNPELYRFPTSHGGEYYGYNETQKQTKADVAGRKAKEALKKRREQIKGQARF